MELGFVGQPYRDWQCGSTFLSDALADVTIDRLLVVSAWARSSGLDLIASDLRDLRARGGQIDFFVGVDLRGSTVQGLELAKEIGSTVRIVHDPDSGTFHPKIYLATGPTAGYALIGSNNLTAGGLSFNYEGALGLSFRTADTPDFVTSIELLAERLIEDKEICKRLTPAMMKRLVAEGWLVDELKDRRLFREDRTRRGPKTPHGSKPLFGRSRFDKRSKPPPRRSGSDRRGAGDARSGKGATTRKVQSVGTPDSWWKELGPGDAQRSPRGHVTGVVRLTAPRDAKNRARFFRRVFFREETWRVRRDSRGNRLEVATIKVQASIEGRDLGLKDIEVDYGAFRDVRGRATTVMHWGELQGELARKDVTGSYLLIERGSNAYSLSLCADQPR